jgi:hypothetical protein
VNRIPFALAVILIAGSAHAWDDPEMERRIDRMAHGTGSGGSSLAVERARAMAERASPAHQARVESAIRALHGDATGWMAWGQAQDELERAPADAQRAQTQGAWGRMTEAARTAEEWWNVEEAEAARERGMAAMVSFFTGVDIEDIQRQSQTSGSGGGMSGGSANERSVSSFGSAARDTVVSSFSSGGPLGGMVDRDFSVR